MFKGIVFFTLIFLFLFVSPTVIFAQESLTPEEFYKAEVIKIITSGETFIDENKSQPYQTVLVKILDGREKEKEVTVDHGKMTTISDDQKSNRR